MSGLKKNNNKSELDKQIHSIMLEKRDLFIKEDRNQISQKEYDKELARLESIIRELNKKKIEQLRLDMIKREKDIKDKQQKVIEKLKELTPRKKRVVKTKPIIITKKKMTIRSHNKGLKPDSHKTKKISKTKNTSRTKSSEDSYASLILKALKHPKIDSEQKVIAMVNVWKPGAHPTDLSKYIKNIISLIKRGSEKRFYGHFWDDKKYQVKTTCQTRL